MRLTLWCSAAGLAAVCAAIVSSSPRVAAQTPSCTMTGYKAASGLTASMESGGVALVWAGDPGQQVRMRLAIENQSPAVREIAVQRDGKWTTVVEHAAPDFR